MMTETMDLHFEFEKLVRIMLVAIALTVGALQVTQCRNDDDISGALSDQHSRMHGE